ncbi:MAG: epoxyqueuosine reductase [Flavobacteriales bacterium]|jgi:epoxyqueuosine reductase
MTKTELTYQVKQKAYALGFSFVGISKSEFLSDEAPRLESWLKNSYQGEMSYMNNHFDKRLDPTILVPDSESVISLLYNYYTDQGQNDPSAPKISKYAYGKDYHNIIQAKLKILFGFIEELVGEISGRTFVDSAPVLDKAWASKSGLGWIGKHSNLITREQGSYLFIAEIILDVKFDYDGPIQDYCGTCTKCIDACPTGAIIQPYQVDGSRCISYFTIELKDAIPQEMKGQFDNWMFGCDICQEVCPWNKFSKNHETAEFDPHPNLLAMSAKDWEELKKEQFQEVFRKSAVKRTKYDGLVRNIKFLGES